MEILGKLGSALSGFWWALDDHEKKSLLMVAAWLAAVIFVAPVERGRRAREREEIAAEVVRMMGGERG